jgi:hypothetical protein
VAFFIRESNFGEGRREAVEGNELVIAVSRGRFRGTALARLPLLPCVRRSCSLRTKSERRQRRTSIALLASVREATIIGEMHNYVI